MTEQAKAADHHRMIWALAGALVLLNGALVLGGLSVAGLLMGIAFHVRSFLQLGTAFLGVSLLTIVWYAAEDLGWTWVWYVAGIALGAMIITLFALFEKKRTEMTAMLREMREWRG